MATLRVKEICKEQNMTLADLASKMKITASALSQNLKKPSFDTLEKLASALDVEVSELFTPKNDFIAFVRTNGQTHTFTSVEDLREYVITSEGLYLCCNEDAPASEMCQDEAQETKSETPDTERQ